MQSIAIITAADKAPYLMSAKHLQAMGIARTMVYNMMNTEGFPVLKIGNRKLVPKDKFMKWIEEQMEEQNGFFTSN